MKKLLILFNWIKAAIILLLIYFLVFLAFKYSERKFGTFELITGLSIILWFVIDWLEEKIEKRLNSS